MTRAFLTFAIFLSLVSLSFAAPSLHIRNPQYDLGTITQKDKAEHVFVFQNRGSSDLVIEKLVPS
jgi:hypothetical protein